MPALGHGAKGGLGGEEDGADRRPRPRSPGRPVPERSAAATRPPPPSPRLPSSDPHCPLHPSCVPLAKRTGEGGASLRQPWSWFPVTPPCCPGSRPPPSSAPPAGSQSPRRPAPPPRPDPAPSSRPRPVSQLGLPGSGLQGYPRAASALPRTLGPVLSRPQFCVLQRRPFPAQRSLSGWQASQTPWGLKLSLYFWLGER